MSTEADAREKGDVWQVSGISCSENGLIRISGIDRYKVCTDCGKILTEFHKDY